jgi:hypothetical protein
MDVTEAVKKKESKQSFWIQTHNSIIITSTKSKSKSSAQLNGKSIVGMTIIEDRWYDPTIAAGMMIILFSIQQKTLSLSLVVIESTLQRIETVFK